MCFFFFLKFVLLFLLDKGTTDCHLSSPKRTGLESRIPKSAPTSPSAVLQEEEWSLMCQDSICEILTGLLIYLSFAFAWIHMTKLLFVQDLG